MHLQHLRFYGIVLGLKSFSDLIIASAKSAAPRTAARQQDSAGFSDALRENLNRTEESLRLCTQKVSSIRLT